MFVRETDHDHSETPATFLFPGRGLVSFPLHIPLDAAMTDTALGREERAADVSSRPSNAMPHLPGLDGLRGLAVIGVLLFHGGFSWAKGGFLGVSTFFTLSGFLITNLLVREWDRSDGIDLGNFWIRRFRRLLPAALIAIALVGVVWWRIGTAEQLDNLRADMLAALGYVANWRFLTGGQSYADLFLSPSPLQHFWSLAIEEQFYVIFPVFVIVVMKFGGRRLLTTLLVMATAFSVILQVSLRNGVDRVYYGTDTRAAELLVGCLLAVWWSGRQRFPIGRHGRADGEAPALWIDALGGLAIVGMFWAWFAVPESSMGLARGGFPLYACATTAIIFAATRRGLVTTFLSVPVLRWAGLISYGLYLFHWPIFLVLDSERTGIDNQLVLFTLRMSVTIAIALASYFLVEDPIRRGTMLKTGRSALIAALAGAVVVASLAFVVTFNPPASVIPYANFEVGRMQSEVIGEQNPTGTIAPTVAGATADSVLWLGDSGAYDATPAVAAAYNASGTRSFVSGAFPGFGLTNPKIDWRLEWQALVDEHHPTLVLIMLGGWDLGFQKENGDAAYLEIVKEATTLFTSTGAKVLWISMLPGGTTPDRETDRVVELVPTYFGDDVVYVDIESSLRRPDGEFGDYPRSYVDPSGQTILLRKPDSWHLCPVGAARVANEINTETARIGWSNRATSGWEIGSWTTDARYDDPKGGCVVGR
jgi:peptidoglycan/LPS O-acetylase OafA/YrhL